MPTAQPPIAPTSFTTFGDLLKYLRRRARLTQRELAIAVGYSEGQINRLEKNQRTADVTTLPALFVPALAIEDDPVTIARLSELAIAARGEPIPASVTGRQRTLAQNNNEITQGKSVPIHDATASSMVAIDLRRANPYRLPQPLTTFIGREDEIEKISHLLRQARLVTLTGVGGIGKTRLSLALGATMVAAFADGVCLVELAPIADPMRVPQAIVAALQLPEQPDRALTEMLITQLCTKQLLLILDNCEHLIAACANITEQLLSGCPHLHILATSREALRLPGEIVWRVPPMTTPDPACQASLTELQAYDAVRLFEQHAVAAHPGFFLTKDNVQAVIQICYHLDGIPLAIEMAAAQTAALTLKEIVTALADRFVLLTGGSRTALPRQQTLRATLDWSYALLTLPEQTLLARLAVFVGGWTAEAAHAICDATLPLLLRLVQKSLVVAVQTADQTRYFLLETIREYARELGAAARFEREVAYTFHMAVIGVMRHTFGQAIATARAYLADAVFAEVWAEGAAMSWEEVVAYALTF